MAWQVKEQYLDEAMGHHVIHLHDPEVGALHVLQIIVNHDACPLCGHVSPKTNLGDIDVKAIIAEELQNLEKSRENERSHARTHRLAKMRADGKAR